MEKVEERDSTELVERWVEFIFSQGLKERKPDTYSLSKL